MYKFQIVDAFNQEILIEEECNDLNFISELFRTSPNPDVMDCMITDSKNRTLSCKYDCHSVIKNDENITYRIFFKTKLVKEVKERV